MGSFSWLKADTLTNIKNIAYDHPFKCLIPNEFGGGYILDTYQDYGYLGKKPDGNPKHDMYELLAFWNADVIYDGKPIREHLKYDGDFPQVKEIDKYSDDNRNYGISIGCYDSQIALLKYPLKLVSVEFEGTYEDCPGRSYGDPDQGFHPTFR